MRLFIRVLVLTVCVGMLLSACGCDAKSPSPTYGSGPGSATSQLTAGERGLVREAVDAAVEGALDQPVELSAVSLRIRPPFAAATATPLSDSGAAAARIAV